MDPGPTPEEKPQPKNFPRRNPTAVLLPSIDTYGASGRVNYSNDPRFRPILAQLNTLLNDILLIAPIINTPVHEQLTLVERLKKDIEKNPIERKKGKELKRCQLRKDSMARSNVRNISTT